MSTLNVTMDHQEFPARQSGSILAGFTRWMGAVADLVFRPADYEPRTKQVAASLALAGSCCGEWISDEVWQAIDEAAGLNRSKQEEKRDV